MPRTIGCKFCYYRTKTLSWTPLFDHALCVHPVEYQAVQEWLKGKIFTEEEQLFAEWDDIIA